MAGLHIAQEIFNLIYPVGSVYMSMNSTNPSVLFGGTWKSIEGRFPIGVGTNTDDNNQTWTINVRQAYGEYTHTLTINEMPRHTHALFNANSGGNVNSYNGNVYPPTGDSTKTWGYIMPIEYAGADWQHNNMPPYIGIYMWERTS